MKIIVFSFGEAKNPRTWSNVPSNVVKELEKEGHDVSCVDVYRGSRLLEFLWRRCNSFSRLLFGKDTLVLLELLPFMKKYYDHLVRRAVKQYPNPEVLLFFTYCFGGEIQNVNSILFCDFTVDYLLKKRLKRNANWLEKRIISHQDEVIKRATKVVSLFPEAAEYYQSYYKTSNIYTIPGHILNCDWRISDYSQIIKNKYSSNLLVFIGRKSYIDGAKCLIRTVLDYNNHHEKQFKLLIIGVTKSDLKMAIPVEAQIDCIGFLNKSIKNENDRFYRSIENAKIVINTTKKWAGISSMVEAMYLYTPVITTKYEEFQAIFGDNIDFGLYCKAEDDLELAKSIEKLEKMDYSAYEKMCLCGHNSVKDFSWENVTKVLLPKASNVIKDAIYTKVES